MKLFVSLILIAQLSGLGCNESFNYVTKECNHKLRQISSIEHFREFMYHYKLLVETNEEPNGRRLIKCFALKEPLLELEKILDLGNGSACQTDHIDRMIEFHSLYLTKSKNKDNNDKANPTHKSPNLSSYLSYFFSLYAHQVSLTCKLHLMYRVKEAQKQHDCIRIISRFLPSNPDDEKGANQDLKEMSKFIEGFNRVENFAPIKRVKNSHIPQAYLDVMISDEVVEKVEELKESCRIIEPFYEAMFAPIGALAQIGYLMDDAEKMDENDASLLKCWLASAQLCQGILRTHLTVNNNLEVDPELNSKFISIELGSLPEDTAENQVSVDSIRYVDYVLEISPKVVSSVNKKFTTFGKLKRKALSMVRGVIEKYIDLKAIQQAAGEKFINALTDIDRPDSKVAFSGKKFNDRKYSPVSIITDDADTFVQLTSPFWNKELGLMVSSIVAVVMSAAFVWFSLYAMVSALRSHMHPADDGNFKGEWKSLRDQRLKKLSERMNKKSPRDKFYAYRPT